MNGQFRGTGMGGGHTIHRTGKKTQKNNQTAKPKTQRNTENKKVEQHEPIRITYFIAEHYNISYRINQKLALAIFSNICNSDKFIAISCQIRTSSTG
jgi:DNA topoisomerase IA